MKRLITIISAGIIALLSFSSCDFEWVNNTGSAEAVMTCRYAGGLPANIVRQNYDLDNIRLNDQDVEDIFLDLCEIAPPGFTYATLEIHIYDFNEHYKKTRVFDFWWEATDPMTGDGYYAWDEVEE